MSMRCIKVKEKLDNVCHAVTLLNIFVLGKQYGTRKF